jgi:LysR family transcriptional regulator, transcriptional activator for bauABCD operon
MDQFVRTQSRYRAVLGNLSDMDLRLLRIFKSVVECGGMSAAELELNISASTLSRHMKDLEGRLGLVLCRRGRAGFALTPEGMQVYESTLELLGAVNLFRNRIHDIHDRLGGSLEVAVFDKTITNPLARIDVALKAFHQLAPEVEIKLHVTHMNDIERGLLDGRFQVGIIPAHRTSGSLIYRNLFDEHMLLYCAKGHPLYGADHSQLDWTVLQAHPFAGLGHHSPNMELSHSMGLRRTATGFDQEAIATLIQTGCYIGFLPDHYGRLFEATGQLQAIAPDRFHYDCQFVAMWRLSPQPSRAAQTLLECLEKAHSV